MTEDARKAWARDVQQRHNQIMQRAQMATKQVERALAGDENAGIDFLSELTAKNWQKKHAKHMPTARHYALKSKDRSTKVGCILVSPNGSHVAQGYNGFHRGADDMREQWHERPLKYKVTLHAEDNVISNAARNGVSTEGTTAYVWIESSPKSKWTHGICSVCASRLVNAGIVRVVVNGECDELSAQIFATAGVEVVRWEEG